MQVPLMAAGRAPLVLGARRHSVPRFACQQPPAAGPVEGDGDGGWRPREKHQANE